MWRRVKIQKVEKKGEEEVEEVEVKLEEVELEAGGSCWRRQGGRCWRRLASHFRLLLILG